MGIQKFKINTINKIDSPLVEFKKEIIIEDLQQSITKGLNDTTIDIHNYEIPEGVSKSIRDVTERITINIDPEWVYKDSKNMLSQCIFENERIDEIIILNVILSCPITREIIEVKRFNVRDIEGENTISFRNIELAEFKEKLVIESNFTRTKGHIDEKSFLGNKKYSIICENNPISVYIDEVQAPGGDHLNIQPENLGKLLFKLKDWNNNPLFEPGFLYNKEFEKQIKGGDYYNSVQLFLMMSLIIYSQDILKWVMFGSGFDRENIQHMSILNFILKILDIKKEKLLNIIDDDQESKLEKFFEFSNDLTENIQTYSISYKSIFRKFIDNES